MPDDKATYAQPCRYCSMQAVASLLYGDKADEYMPVCWGHEEIGRREIRKLGKGVLDMVAIDNTGVSGMRGSSMYRIPRSEARMARALEPAPAYPAPTANSNFGLRVSRARAASAVEVAPEVSPGALPIRRVSGEDPPKSFLAALGGEWKNLRAYRVHSDRITVSLDGQHFTLYTRKG